MFRASRAVALLALLTGAAALAHGGDRQVTWSFEDGWLVAGEEGARLLGPGSGWAADVTVDDQPLSTDADVARAGGPVSDGSLEARYIDGRGMLVDRYEPFGALGKDAWLRTLAYTNTSGDPQDVTGACMRLTPVVPAGGLIWHPRMFWMGETGGGRAVCVSYRGSTDFYHLATDGEGRPYHRIDACWRLAPGESAVIGSQGIWLGTAGGEAFRDEAQRWYKAIDLRVPEPPQWLEGAILYEFNAGGHVESRFSDVGGFDRLARQVNYLTDLGVTAVWLQGVHEHKSLPNPMKGGWNLYAPIDYTKVDPILGGADGLKRLTDALHERGIHVIGEIVPHGARSRQAEAMEEWWTYARNGTARRTWGGRSMDYSSPAWQSVMGDAVAMLARDYGIEGVRVDVAEGSGPNWRSPRTNHASYSTLAGSVEMLEAIRDAMAAHVPNPVLIPENWNNAEHFRLSAVGYGHATWMLFAREIAGLAQEPATMADAIREFLERERGAYPRGARVLRTLGNHDTVVEAGRTQQRYGAGLARALYGVCLMAPGIPMIYQEEEVGSYEALRRMNQARRRIPEFAGETVDYFAVEFAPGVFACLRSVESAHAVGLANLAGEAVTGVVRLGEGVGAPDGTRVFDAVSGRESEVAGNGFPWELAAYETALIRIGQRPKRAVSERRFRGEASTASHEPAPLGVDVTEEGVRIRGGRLSATLRAGPGPWRRGDDGAKYASDYGWIELRPRENAWEVALSLEGTALECTPEFVVHGASRWVVSGRTALLEDHVLRRHFPFPTETDYIWQRNMIWGRAPWGSLYDRVAPTGRLWQSVLEPLHPNRAAAAFEDQDGRGLVLSEVAGTARNIVLTDRTDEAIHRAPTHGTHQPEEYGLALRFYGQDPDLSPRVAAVGLGQPWTMDAYPTGHSGDLTLQFVVSLMDRAEAMTALEARRLPVSRGEAVVTREGEAFSENHRAVWLIKPGTVTWSDLAPVEGRYRIRLELRHSEASATGTDLDDAYEIRVDDEVVPLEWVARNTFQTGNAFFGHALTPCFDLTERGRRIAITTRKPWCAVRKGFHLIPGAAHGEPDDAATAGGGS